MPATPDLLHQLRNGQYDELQSALDGLQQLFEVGKASETELLDAFRKFQNPDPALGEKFTEWLAAHPQSYVAHTALATWFLGCAWDARGADLASRVSDRGWRGMHYFIEQAQGAGQHAATLTANPLAAWTVVGGASNTLGCQVSAQDVQEQKYPDWFTQGVQANPHSFTLRNIMLFHLRTEWGGSEEQMLKFVRQQQDSGLLSQGDMQRLWAEFHSSVSHHALAFLKDDQKAVERAMAATELHELQAAQLFMALTHAKRPAEERRSALERYLKAAEGEAHARPSGNFYWALYNSSDFMEPLVNRVAAFLQRVSVGGEADAAIALGRLVMLNRKWILSDPLPALKYARDQGNREAAEVIVELQEVGLGLKAALSTSPEKRQDILKAADLGSDEMSWRVHQEFDAYRKQFDLDDRAKYRYLLRAADAGNNDARFALAQQLRGGFVEVGDDGVLRPVDTPPLQDSLNYAKHLLERAAAEEHKGAQKVLKRAKDTDWDAKTAKRINVSGIVSEREASRGGRPWWWWWLWTSVVVGLLRACATFFGQ